MFEIRKRDVFGGGVIYKSEGATCLNEALREYLESLKGDSADLRCADLRRVNLGGADLCGADLCGADLSYADLRFADLRGADLRGADLCDADLSYADLSYADLSYADLRGAYLRYADLRGAYLRYAYLRGAEFGGGKSGNGLTPEMIGLPPADPAFELMVIESALAPNALEMGRWHTCKTTHCIAGWAVHLSGAAGKALEVVTSESCAGALLVPGLAHLFYESNEVATEALKARLEELKNGD